MDAGAAASPDSTAPSGGETRLPGLRHLALVVGLVWLGTLVPEVLLAVRLIWPTLRLAVQTRQSLSPETMEQAVAAATPVLLLSGAIFNLLLTPLVLWYVLCRRFGRPFLEGMALTRPSNRALAGSVALAAGLTVVWSLRPEFESSFALEEILNRPSGFYAFLIVAIVAPLPEELYYRGALLPVLSRRLGDPAALAIVVVWFGAAHVHQLFPHWAAIAQVTLVGAVCTAQRSVTGSLVPSIVTHSLYNGALVVTALRAGS